MNCKNCGEKTTSRNSYNYYCSNACQHDYQIEQRIKSGKFSARTAKNWLIRQDNCCKICGLKNWNNKEIILILDHINGDSSDNSLENLRLVCANCDSQLPTFKNRNKGNGRHSRRQRYSSGKSY
jgi:hypothetical protein